MTNTGLVIMSPVLGPEGLPLRWWISCATKSEAIIKLETFKHYLQNNPFFAGVSDNMDAIFGELVYEKQKPKTDGGKEYWQVVPEKSTQHWLEVRDPHGLYNAYPKWDGCIGYTRYLNQPEGEEFNSLYICDIDEEIEQLQALKV